MIGAADSFFGAFLIATNFAILSVRGTKCRTFCYRGVLRSNYRAVRIELLTKRGPPFLVGWGFAVTGEPRVATYEGSQPRPLRGSISG